MHLAGAVTLKGTPDHQGGLVLGGRGAALHCAGSCVSGPQSSLSGSGALSVAPDAQWRLDGRVKTEAESKDEGVVCSGCRWSARFVAPVGCPVDRLGWLFG